MSDHIRLTVSGGLLDVEFNRPERRNAITTQMYEDLAEAFEQAEANPAISIIILRGSDTIFTAGNDLNDFRDNPPIAPEGVDIMDLPPFRFMRALLRSTKIVVAGVEGMAVGIGTTMLLHCDLVVAGQSSKFSLPFVNLGLLPEFGSSRLLPKIMGRQRAARCLLLGEPFDAPTALTIGLVSEVVEDGSVYSNLCKLAKRLLAQPPIALTKTKAITIPEADEIEALIRYEAKEFSELLGGEEFAEASAAFFDKRTPHFKRAS